MASSGTDPGLLRCPKNLRECIDWVLRATGKDDLKGTGNINNLKNALKAELGSSVKDVDLDTQLKALASGLEKFIGYGSGGQGIKGGSYESSYSKDATWPECGSKPCPSCSSCSHSGSSTSCNGECCPDCDVRKAAKIFLGMLPCLYYALRYLKDKCKGDWSDLYISNKDYSLGRFLVGMGYDVDKELKQGKQGSDIFGFLNTLFKDSPGPLEKLYEKSKNYFTSRFTSHVPSSKSPSQPKTVREILLWLSGLPFTPGFEALLKHCKGLCEPVKDSVQFNDFEASLFNSCFLLPISVISAIQRPQKDKSFIPSPSEWQKFCYPEDPSDLLDMLFDYVRKVFVPLKFLCMQCELTPGQGGWTSCRFGQRCADALKKSSSFTSSSSGSCSSCSGHDTYLCTASANPDVHDGHCLNGQCLGSNSGTCPGKSASNTHTSSAKCKFPCPHPLQAFLTATSDSQSQSPSSPFRLPSSFARIDFSQTPPVILDASSEILTMGFKSESLISPARSGESLFVILDIFVGDSDSDKKVCFLRDLLRFLLCLTRTPPSTFGEIFSFYYKLAEWINPGGGQKKTFKTSLETEISSHPGTYSGQKLTDAVFDVYGSDHPRGKHSATPPSLRLLSHCWGGDPKPCGNFLFPLATNAWDLFAPSNSDVYLSWLCYFAPRFHSEFKAFHQKASEKFSSCCLQDSSKCPKIVHCPCTLPFLYKNGFTFMKASNLSGKNCSNFITQLGNFVTKSMLDKLIEVVEEFLWHIRKPFFFFILAFWAFVISYFLYVQLYKLDLLHLKSHAHFSRSFKILPSTLFSDASSKLKDLSYFTL